MSLAPRNRPRVLALALIAALGLGVPATTASAPKPDLSGTWKRNAEKSDDPREVMQKAREQMGRPGGGFGGPGGRRGGLGGPGGRGPGRGPGGGPGGDPRGRGPGGFDGMASVAETLQIEQSESELKVIAGESVRIFYLDGEKRERETPEGFKMEVRARWEGEAVVVEQKTSRGAKLSESYALSPDGASLVVTRRVESPRFKTPLVVRSVYEPAALDSK